MAAAAALFLSASDRTQASSAPSCVAAGGNIVARRPLAALPLGAAAAASSIEPNSLMPSAGTTPPGPFLPSYLAGTLQSPSPCAVSSPGSAPRASTRRSAPPARSSSAATTASSSTGLSEHVEYTSLPPTFVRAAQRTAMRSCSGCRPLPRLGDQRRHRSAALRSVPSPEHGTSASTRSKSSASGCRTEQPRGPGTGKVAASWHVTSSAGEARRLT